jgi:hypothetical protein
VPDELLTECVRGLMEPASRDAVLSDLAVLSDGPPVRHPVVRAA